MSLELIKFAFVAGEVSKTFFGRSDLEKFDLGLETAINWFVDYRGGLSTRPGSLYCDPIEGDDNPVKLERFKFSPDLANTYVLLFGDNYIRYLQDGSYVLEANKTVVSITNADPGVATITAHGYSTGNWVKFSVAGMTQLNARCFSVTVLSADTFSIQDEDGNDVDTSSFGAFTSGTCARIYTTVSPYAHSELAQLSVFQYRDKVRLTHPSYPPYELTRLDHTDWTLAQTTFGTEMDTPTNVSLTPLSAGGSAVGFAITAVGENEDESQPSPVEVSITGGNYTLSAGGMHVKWDPVDDASYYNVYRTVITHLQAYYSPGQQLGFLGRAYGPRFTDNNIIPDFAITPPRAVNPFANNSIEHINITAPGAGYDRFTTTVSLSGGGSGFVGQVLVDEATGEILGVIILNGGSGYVNPTVSFSGGGGAGATATATTSPASGNNPRLACVFQQRQMYFATDNKPLTVFGSKPGRFNNFDYGNVVVDNDAFEYDLDSDEIAPIKHVLNMRGGLLLMTGGSVWQLNGGANGQPLTATQALAEPQTFTGVSDVKPLTIDTEVVYIESKGFTVRMLAYNEFSRVYSGNDISVLSNHLFNSKNYITNWTYASDPFKLVWSVRLDGVMLTLTLLKEQNVYAWTRAQTKGQYMNVLALEENNTDAVYTVVKRYVRGRWRQFIERIADRRFESVDDVIALDCALHLDCTYPAATLQLSGVSGSVTLTSDVNVFSAGDVGKVFRFSGGKAYVTTYTDQKNITVNFVRDVNIALGDAKHLELVAKSGSWTLDSTVSSVSGLWHLEGETVTVFYDGFVQHNVVVVNGAVTLPASASRVVIGLPYTCYAKSLPITMQQATVEARRKRNVGIAVRLHESRALKVGTSISKVYEAKERTTEPYGEPTNLIEGIRHVLTQSIYEDDAVMHFRVDDPLPVSLLGYVQSVEVGDDPDTKG